MDRAWTARELADRGDAFAYNLQELVGIWHGGGGPPPSLVGFVVVNLCQSLDATDDFDTRLLRRKRGEGCGPVRNQSATGIEL